MKKYLRLLAFFIGILTINSCKDDDTFNYTLFEADAPSELTAGIVVSEDNTGVVTVSPAGKGVSSFKVYFTSSSDTPQIIGIGKTITHVYEEGNHTIKIVALATNDKMTEITENISVSRTAILGLNAEVVISENDPLEVTVTPTSDNAKEFDVYFGEEANDTAVKVAPGESATHTYAVGGAFTIKVVGKGDNSRTAEITKDITLDAPAPVDNGLSINFDDGLSFNAFGGVTFEIVDNPFASGTNTAASKVGKFTNSGTAWEGATIDLAEAIDFSKGKTITMKFYAAVSVPLVLKFEGGVNGERQVEIVKQHSGSGWETLTFDYATEGVKSYIDGNQGVGESFVPVGKYAKIAFFIDGPGTTDGEFYMDDLAQPLAGGSDGGGSVSDFDFNFDNSEVTYAFSPFGGAAFEIVDNPFASGTNTAASKVGKFTNSGATWEGFAFELPAAIDFSKGKKIEMKFYAAVSTPLVLKFESGVNGEREVEIVKQHSGSGWETFTFDYATEGVKSYIDGNQGVGESFVPDGHYGKMAFFIDGPGTTDGDFYMDDIVQQE